MRSPAVIQRTFRSPSPRCAISAHLVVPTETIAMRWQRQAGVGHFKAIAKLIR
jgi:hypothetical protein